MGKPPRSPVMTKRSCSSPVRGHSYSHRVWYRLPGVQSQRFHRKGAQVSSLLVFCFCPSVSTLSVCRVFFLLCFCATSE